MCTVFRMTNVTGQMTKEVRKLEDFHAVHIDKNIDIDLVQSDSERVVIVADKKITDSIQTKVDKGNLYILFKDHIIPKVKPLVTIYVKNLTSVQTKTGSDVTSINTLKVNRFVAYMVNGSDLKLDIQADELILFLSDGSDAILSGKVNRLSITSKGGSDIEALGFETVNCELQLTGGSDAMVNVSRHLDIFAKGGCNISVKGDPPDLTDRLEDGSKLFYLKK
jgi:hypothetical protein